MIQISGGKLYLFDDAMQLLAEVDAAIDLHHYGSVSVSVDLTKQPEPVRKALRHCQMVFPMPVLFGASSTTILLTSKVIPIEVPNG